MADTVDIKVDENEAADPKIQNPQPVPEKTADSDVKNGSADGEKVESEPLKEKSSSAESKTEAGDALQLCEISELEQKIIRQVEYYFGDYNLPKDKFLQENIKKDNGWIAMETMLNFQRLKKLSEDATVICNALLKSSSKLMEVNEDRTKIRRSVNKPLPELSDARRQEIGKRTVYVKGFPLQGTSLDMLLEFFGKFGATDNVQMRNYHDKVEDCWKFKGSVFVTFPTRESAEAFLKLESVKHEDKELIKKWQFDYLEEKKVEAKEGKRGKNKHKKAQEKPEEGATSEENGAKSVEVKTEDENIEKEEKPKHVYGAVLGLKGIGEKTEWYAIKDKLVEIGANVVFVDYTKGDAEAFARLSEAGSAKTVFAKMEDGKIDIDDVQVEARVLEGEEEQKFLDSMAETRKNFKRNSMKRKGGPMRGRGRGRGAKRGRR